jgi:hypothetical protein
LISRPSLTHPSCFDNPRQKPHTYRNLQRHKTSSLSLFLSTETQLFKNLEPPLRFSLIFFYFIGYFLSNYILTPMRFNNLQLHPFILRFPNIKSQVLTKCLNIYIK